MESKINGRVLLAVVVAIAVFGCQPRTGRWSIRVGQKKTEVEIDGSILRAAMYDWADEAASEIAGVANNIARAAPDTRTREFALKWKLRSATGLQALVLEPDPRHALVNTWMAVVQGRRYFTVGNGKNIFGEQTDQAVAVVYMLEERFEDIIRSNLPMEVFTAAKAEIERMAVEQPVALRAGIGRLRAGNVTQIPRQSELEEILTLPLAPLAGLKGVATTADALGRMNIIIGIITEIIEDMPQHIRWQTEALLLELESSRSMEELRDVVQRTNEHVIDLMEQTKRAVDLADQIPDEVERQRKETLDTISNELTATLEDVDTRMTYLVDHIFWRLVQLVCVALIGVGILVFLAKKRLKADCSFRP